MCADSASTGLKILYCVGVFPSVSQTFVVTQLSDALSRGHDISVWSQRRGHRNLAGQTASVHQLLERCHFPPALPEAGLRRFWLAVSGAASSVRDVRLLRETSRPGRFGWARINPARRFLYARDLAHWVGEECPDIVHVHFAHHAQLPLCVMKAGLAGGSKLLVTCHGHDLHAFPSSRYRDLFAFADAVTVNSNYTRGIAVSMGCPNAKLHVIPMGLDTQAFSPPPRQDSSRPLRILHVGRLVEFKGADLAVDAVARLRDAHGTDARLDIIGDGPWRDVLEQRIREHRLEEAVTVHGARPREAVVEAMGQADVFLLPGVPDRTGRQENQGVVIQEAQAMELPVIVSSVGGMPEGLQDGETGFVVEPRDINTVADRLEFLTANPSERIRMGQRGRAFVTSHYDLRVLGERWAALYRHLADSSAMTP